MAVIHPSSTPASMQRGTVARLNLQAGFGYVQAEDGEHAYIFVVGTALNHSQVRALHVGQPVRFRLSGHARVEELVGEEVRG